MAGGGGVKSFKNTLQKEFPFNMSNGTEKSNKRASLVILDLSKRLSGVGVESPNPTKTSSWRMGGARV